MTAGPRLTQIADAHRAAYVARRDFDVHDTPAAAARLASAERRVQTLLDDLAGLDATWPPHIDATQVADAEVLEQDAAGPTRGVVSIAGQYAYAVRGHVSEDAPSGAHVYWCWAFNAPLTSWWQRRVARKGVPKAFGAAADCLMQDELPLGYFEAWP